METQNSTPLYVCRHKKVDLLPGKYSGSLHCHITYDGKDFEFNDSEVEILTSTTSNYQWVPRHGGDPIPDGAFVAGQTEHGIPLYVGRCEKQGLVGKIDGYFYYSVDSKEYQNCIDHEILSC